MLGSAVLILYGFIPTFQPASDFGRTYAVSSCCVQQILPISHYDLLVFARTTDSITLDKGMRE